MGRGYKRTHARLYSDLLLALKEKLRTSDSSWFIAKRISVTCFCDHGLRLRSSCLWTKRASTFSTDGSFFVNTNGRSFLDPDTGCFKNTEGKSIMYDSCPLWTDNASPLWAYSEGHLLTQTVSSLFTQRTSLWALGRVFGFFFCFVLFRLFVCLFFVVETEGYRGLRQQRLQVFDDGAGT